jgi:hypothetical protein
MEVSTSTVQCGNVFLKEGHWYVEVSEHAYEHYGLPLDRVHSPFVGKDILFTLYEFENGEHAKKAADATNRLLFDGPNHPEAGVVAFSACDRDEVNSFAECSGRVLDSEALSARLKRQFTTMVSDW